MFFPFRRPAQTCTCLESLHHSRIAAILEKCSFLQTCKLDLNCNRSLECVVSANLQTLSFYNFQPRLERRKVAGPPLKLLQSCNRGSGFWLGDSYGILRRMPGVPKPRVLQATTVCYKQRLSLGYPPTEGYSGIKDILRSSGYFYLAPEL